MRRRWNPRILWQPASLRRLRIGDADPAKPGLATFVTRGGGWAPCGNATIRAVDAPGVSLLSPGAPGPIHGIGGLLDSADGHRQLTTRDEHREDGRWPGASSTLEPRRPAPAAMSLLAAFPGLAPEALRASPLAQDALRAAGRLGHGEPVTLSWAGGCAWWFHTPANPGHGGACVQQGSRFAASVGTAIWRGLTGERLLERVLADFDGPESIPWREISGSFALLIGDAGTAWLLNDAVGLQKVYRRADRTLYSTSFMACRATLRRPSLDRLRAQEYVLLGSNHGHETPLDGIRIVDPTAVVDLRTGDARTLHAAEAWRSEPEFASMADAVHGLSARIADEFRSMVTAHGPGIGMALSGGFDSRLLLAALDHVGVSPRLYVYGTPADEDVRVAVAKAQTLGLAIEAIDKRRLDEPAAPLGRTRLAGNLAFFDGLPVDGVFDRGSDRQTRELQMRSGTLNLNGGGGEILRNFFYLGPRTFCADDLVGAFYSNWLPAAIPAPDERRALREATGAGILRELGFATTDSATQRRRLTRSDVERVYALFRLRYWMGRNNSVAALHGAFMTPLVHPAWVTLTASLPLAWKSCGDLEAALITRLSPRVASGPSNYGFDFASGPTAAYRRQVAATLHRPIALRRRSARIRRLIGRLPTATLPAEWAAVGLPSAVDWIDPAHLTDRSQLNRLLTLQALLDDDLSGARPEN